MYGSLTYNSVLFLIIFPMFISCQKDDMPQKLDEEASMASLNQAPVNRDLQQIQVDGKLKAITAFSSTGYFLYKGRPMGYHYEMLQKLADHLELELEIVVADNVDQMVSMLQNGDGDIIAYDLAITKRVQEHLAFTHMENITQQVLVQRKPANWRKMKVHQIERALIRSPLDLIGKKVYVRDSSSHYYRLLNLSEEIGGDIEIVPVYEQGDPESLIQAVAEGKIDYTLANEHLAEINKAYWSILDVETKVSLPQRVAWSVRKNSPLFLEAVNKWYDANANSSAFNFVFNKYYENQSAHRERMRSKQLVTKEGNLSKYDQLIRKYADTVGWDWRLLASVIYQESRFEPSAEAWTGAAGLMQMMPGTAESLGVHDLNDPEQSILAGVRYFRYLDRYWSDIEDPEERLKFVLASYNVGFNHVEDARRLAHKYGRDNTKWEGNVGTYVKMKSKPYFYQDEVVQYGYCRGEEPYRYVNEVLERYAQYKAFTDSQPS